METPRHSQIPSLPAIPLPQTSTPPRTNYHIYPPPHSLHNFSIYSSLGNLRHSQLTPPIFFSKSNPRSPSNSSMPQPADYFNQVHSNHSPAQSPLPVLTTEHPISRQQTPIFNTEHYMSRQPTSPLNQVSSVMPPPTRPHTPINLGSSRRTNQDRPSACTIASLLNPSGPTESPTSTSSLKPAAIKRLLNDDERHDSLTSTTPTSNPVVSTVPSTHEFASNTTNPRQMPLTSLRPQPAFDWRRHSDEDLSSKKRQRVSMISYPSAPHLSQLLYAPCVLPPDRHPGSEIVRRTPIPDTFIATRTVVERFVCPYKFPGDNSRCKHDHGSFSRYEFNRSHLTSMHMEYPPKTRKSERETTPGKCMACGVWFRNPEDWITNHLNPGLCPGSLQVSNCLHRKYLFEEAKDTSLTGGVPYVLLADSHPVDS